MECDTCRRTLEPGHAFFTMTLGLSDAPQIVSSEHQELVELTHDLTFCANCEPKARELFDGLLAQIWTARADDEPELGTELGTEIQHTLHFNCGCEARKDECGTVMQIDTCSEHERELDRTPRLTLNAIVDNIAQQNARPAPT